MNPLEVDLFAERQSLASIRDYARQRMVAPPAVLLGVLLRASTAAPANVMIPAIIGTPKPLNLVVVTVGPSGLGKTASDDVAEDYWPADFPVFPFGTAEGLVQAFEPDEDGRPEVPNIIFASSEIDNWAALGERAGSMIFPVLRQIVTGDPIGQKNASKAHTRIVAKRSYRAGISLSAQPESKGAALLFSDAPGGFPQRCLFGPSTDPDAPDEPPTGIEPYRPEQTPDFTPNVGPYYEIPFPEAVADEIRDHRRRVLRGEPGTDPLDGHRNLTKAKVAAGLMLLEGRQGVTEDDWRIAGRIMAMSDATRASLIRATQQAAQVANRARALASADRDEIVSDRKLERTKQAVVRWLTRHRELSTTDLRRKIKADLRDYLHAALSELADEGQLITLEVDRGTRYRLPAEGTRCTESTPPNDQLSDGVPEVHGVPAGNVTDLDTRRSIHHDAPRPTRTAHAFIVDYITAHAGPDGWVPVSQIRAAGAAEGHQWDALHRARKASATPRIVTSNTGPNSSWRIAFQAQQQNETSA
jgi:hypothetical protein